MITKLTLRPDRHVEPTVRSKDDSGRHVFRYEVDGLPTGEQVSIAEDSHSRRWKIHGISEDIKGDLTSDYKTPEDGLAALQMDFEK
jgi:hypothetical protein